MNTESISITKFCDLQGVDDTDRATLLRMYKDSNKKSYKEWYEITKNDFASIGIEKEYNEQKPVDKIDDKKVTKTIVKNKKK